MPLASERTKAITATLRTAEERGSTEDETGDIVEDLNRINPDLHVTRKEMAEFCKDIAARLPD